MPTILFANNAQTTLAGAITNVATTANLAAGSGALFPNPSAGQYFVATFNDAATGLLTEIVWVTGRSTDTITMVRAQEGTTALSWNAGDIFSNLWTAGSAAAMLQQGQYQTQAANYTTDTGGAANTYVGTYTPAYSTRVAGTPLRLNIAHSNTGASTFNPGPGASAIVRRDGSALIGGELVAGTIPTLIDDGTNYEYPYMAPASTAATQAGTDTQSAVTPASLIAALANLGIAWVTGDWKWRPDSNTQTGWVRANGLTIGDAASGATERANADTVNLFTYLWNNFGNTQCPVSSGRGANAAADFAANKTITLLDARGMSQIGLDTMGNSAAGRFSGVPFVSGNSSTPGSVAGENTHTLVVGEIPAHTHNYSGTSGTESATHTHSGAGTTPSFLVNVASGGTLQNPASGTAVQQQSATGTESATHTHTYSGTTDNGTGGSGAHNNVHLSMLGTFFIKE